MSLIVNGTTVTKVIVVKDSVSTNLNKLIVNGVVVFQSLPVPTATASFTTYQDGKIVSYGDMPNVIDLIVQYSEESEPGILSSRAAVFLTKYVANNGYPYQTLCRTYVGNEETVPSFMTEDTYNTILSADNQAKLSHIYFPVDYYGPSVIELPFERVFIPVMSQALARFGAAPVADLSSPPHSSEFPQGLEAISSASYTEGPNIFVFMESEEMAEFRQAHPDPDTNVIEKFDIVESSNTYYLLFQAYGVEEETNTEEYHSALSYYFGEIFTSNDNKVGDAKSFYTNTNLSSTDLQDGNIIVMDSLNTWQEYFETQGTIPWDDTNAFYNCLTASHPFAGPWLDPTAAWPDADKSTSDIPVLFLDKVPRGIQNSLKNYPVILGPQAVGESLAVGLIMPDSIKEVGAQNNIDNIKEVYEAFEKDPISEYVLAQLESYSSGTTFFNLYLYQTQETASGNELDPTTYFIVGVRE